MPTANPLPSPVSLRRRACLLSLALVVALAAGACTEEPDAGPVDGGNDGRGGASDGGGDTVDSGFLDDAGADAEADVPDLRVEAGADTAPDAPSDAPLDAGGDVACDGADCADAVADADLGPTLPACLGDESLCDDGDGCTVDSCDATPCADGAPCDGCVHAPVTFGVAPGEPDPPELLATYEVAPYALVEPFDGLPLATPILDIRAAGGSAYVDGGALLLVDDDLGDVPSAFTVSSADAALTDLGEGAGSASVEFEISPEGLARPVFLDLLGPESAAGDRAVASLVPGLGPPGDYVLVVEQGAFGADRTVALAADAAYTLTLTIDAGTASATLFREGGVDGEPLEVGTVVIGSSPGAWRLDLLVEANARAGQTEPVELVAVLDVSSDLTHTPEAVGWTLWGSVMTLGGVRFASDAAPTALWLETDGGLVAADQARDFVVAAGSEEIGFYLVEDPAGGAFARATLFSDLGTDEVQALLGARSASAVMRAEGVGFRREEDGSYGWAPSLEVCR